MATGPWMNDNVLEGRGLNIEPYDAPPYPLTYGSEGVVVEGVHPSHEIGMRITTLDPAIPSQGASVKSASQLTSMQPLTDW